ncbi:hypothetical protein [Streptomyces chartreusis]|uniref:hypothetical protein n=1 Tax=Streptomyces chartreusis TaxID=1969 RepID=UPI0036BE1569
MPSLSSGGPAQATAGRGERIDCGACPARDWMSATRLSLDVHYQALCRARGLDRRTREDAFYVYGRGTMALDLGHRRAAEREAARLRRLRQTCVKQ